MRTSRLLRSRFPLFTIVSLAFALIAVGETTREIPEPLQAWKGWATWNDADHACPSPYSDPSKHLCFWPGRLALQAEKASGKFELSVTVFSETWIPLPGSEDLWPMEVKSHGALLPVVEHDGRPAIKLPPGSYDVEGSYKWNQMPGKIPVPREIGILELTIEGTQVEVPDWDTEGILWLERNRSAEEADKDFLGIKLYSLIEDGIPLWLRTEIELVVSGKGREVELGSVLPEGWKLAAISSQIPVAVDNSGRLKAQVRSGKWTVLLDAFRLDNPSELRYAGEAKPAVTSQLVAFQSRPDFRMVEILGVPSVDVSQTTFPERWRSLPVYRWDTATPLRIEERLRGMGVQKPEGLRIARALWLDEDGRGMTFRDQLSGRMQQIWRLDAAPGQELGAVRNTGGQWQLITRNPQDGALGIEVRERNFNLEAAGRMSQAKTLSATGWRSDADTLNVDLNLPPGWRLFALFGADRLRGDWLTSWTLLDLFLVLILSFAVFRLWGLPAALLAFVAFGLSYHEPGAPRYIWLFLLMPIALLRVVSSGWGRRVIITWKWLTIACLVIILTPFVAGQLQQALYPQLERLGSKGYFLARDFRLGGTGTVAPAPAEAARAKTYDASAQAADLAMSKAAPDSNLMYEANARIQTGPAVPDWSWRSVSFGWNGPVQASQQVHVLLIPPALERGLTILRVVLLLALAGVLLGARHLGGSIFGKPAKLAAVLLVGFLAGAALPARADIPDPATLETLRQRLLETSDAFPTAADIPFASLKIEGRRVTIDAQVHAAIQIAVPLPGRLASWSPLSVLIDNKPDAALRREDDNLWVVLSPGVHDVRIEGLLPDVDEWEWTFQLRPRAVSIDAPEWTYRGVRGVPEEQISLVRTQKSASGEASYDRQDLQTIVAIDRDLELGLAWQIHNKASRLSPTGKAITLRVPLVAGENVLSENAVVRDGSIEIQMGANDSEFAWDSELPITDRIKLATNAGNSWVERWKMVASPVWNLAISGLAPIFEPGNPELVPVWRPWPGEAVDLAISRPEAIAGPTITVLRGTREIAVGSRQRVSKLDLSVRCSLGQDFLTELPADAEITSLTHNGQALPARKDGTKLVIPLRPGEQSLSVGWKINVPLGFRVIAGEIRLPVESANIDTSMGVPDDRWILWATGPQRGPAVRFWSILLCAVIAAWILGRVAVSPLRPLEWMLLAIGLTQVPLSASLVVVGWLFFLAWRGRQSFLDLPSWGYNLLQVFLVLLTAGALSILVAAVAQGLLGNPEMFIVGNGSGRTLLRWYSARADTILPRPSFLSVSMWWYRFLMLAWALWIAAALIRWLRWGWRQFSEGGCFRSFKQKALSPPPVPTKH